MTYMFTIDGGPYQLFIILTCNIIAASYIPKTIIKGKYMMSYIKNLVENLKSNEN